MVSIAASSIQQLQKEEIYRQMDCENTPIERRTTTDFSQSQKRSQRLALSFRPSVQPSLAKEIILQSATIHTPACHGDIRWTYQGTSWLNIFYLQGRYRCWVVQSIKSHTIGFYNFDQNFVHLTAIEQKRVFSRFLFCRS